MQNFTRRLEMKENEEKKTLNLVKVRCWLAAPWTIGIKKRERREKFICEKYDFHIPELGLCKMESTVKSGSRQQLCNSKSNQSLNIIRLFHFASN